MKKRHYAPSLALGTIAAGGTLGILIPPSNPFVLYAILSEQSVGKLFIAGVVPGLILSLIFMIVVFTAAAINPHLAPRGISSTWRRRFSLLKNVGPFLILILLVLGGIWGGIFSATEAGAVGSIGAAVITLAMRRFLPERALTALLLQTAKTTAALFMILIGALVFGYFIAITRLPSMLADWVGGLAIPTVGVIIVMVIIYMILGCIYMDTLAMILLTLHFHTDSFRPFGL